MNAVDVWDGDRIRKLREAAGLSQRGLAEKLECHFRAVQMWEADMHKPKRIYTKKMESLEKKRA